MDSEPKTIAAVDLGSNSFHMVVANVVEGDIRIVDAIKEPVRLASGLGRDGSLDQASRDRAVACLERFGERLRDIEPRHLRVVGTNTFRKARDNQAFRQRASEAVGQRIEIVAGREEARLVYLGVAYSTAAEDDARRLVVDIGGGSTECILGEGGEPLMGESLSMGCVSYSERFFKGNAVNPLQMARARLSAMLELQPLVQRYSAEGWDRAFGSSGTIKAVEAICRAEGFSAEGITPAGLDLLWLRLLEAGSVEAAELKGLSANRVDVLLGGLAILTAVFDTFELEAMTVSSGAMREGILFDLVGRLGQQDKREQTVERFVARYDIDVEQAERVKSTALSLLEQVAEPWQLNGASAHRYLRWACDLHEIGLTVSYKGHHKHAAYLLTHADMPGFSRGDQELIAAVVRGHRRKVTKQHFAGLEPRRATMAERLCVLLRLAVRLNRSRSVQPLPDIQVSGDAENITLAFPDGWLDDHTLTRADLETEVASLTRLGVTLRY